MKFFGAVITILTGALLIYASMDFPDWGDPASPASVHLSPYYLKHKLVTKEVPNVVSAVLADFRGFDTMLETAVVFAAAVAILCLLRGSSRSEGNFVEDEEDFEEDQIPANMIVRTTCRLLVPVMQLFAFYVIAHGHHSPGGGFRGG